MLSGPHGPEYHVLSAGPATLSDEFDSIGAAGRANHATLPAPGPNAQGLQRELQTTRDRLSPEWKEHPERAAKLFSGIRRQPRCHFRAVPRSCQIR